MTRPASAPPAARRRAATTLPRQSSEDPRWAAVVARDRSRDGTFVFSVTTTGIYCRPSCPARRPRRDNVRFHATPDAARAAGFRPCKRCNPDGPSLQDKHRAGVEAACRHIGEAEDEPSLRDLAAVAGLSPHHFHRVFKSVTGVTPKAYAAAQRRQRVRTELNRSTTVTEAIHASGFNAASRFYDKANDSLGMTPTAFRSGGHGAQIRHAVVPCSLGLVLVAATDRGVCAIFFGDSATALEQDLRARFPKATFIAANRDFAKLTAKVVALVEVPSRALDLPLDIRGTAFQQRVWQALRAIPAGTTVTYADVAHRIGAPRAVRAVGTACGANAIAVAIPCHRVVRKDGALPDANYRWGGDRKRALLDKEKTGSG